MDGCSRVPLGIVDVGGYISPCGCSGLGSGKWLVWAINQTGFSRLSPVWDGLVPHMTSFNSPGK